MKKIIPVVLSVSLLGAITPVIDQNHKVEAATTVNSSRFNDTNLYLYSSADKYRVKNGVLQVIYNKKFITPSQKLIKNSTLLNIASSLLDKKQYLYIDYRNGTKTKPQTLTFNSATSSTVAQYGVKPISYQFYLDKTKKTELAKNVKVSLTLDYFWYDVKTDTYYSKTYENQLKNSLLALYGSTTGKQIFNYLIDIHKKYRKNIPDDDKSIKLKRKIKNVQINILVDSLNMYVDFS